MTWGWSREEGSFVEDGESARLISYERDNAKSRDRTGLHRVLIAHETVDKPIPLLAVDASLIGFQEAFMGTVRGTVDTRSMVYVNGPSIGRRSKWSSIEYTAADGVPTKVYSVVFLEDRSLAVVVTMATQGGPGQPDAKDPVDRESSAVEAAACFFPPTDFLNWSKPGDNEVGIGPVGTQFKAAFGPRSDTEEGRETLGREISPINFVTSNLPPTLVIHGDADKLVPIYQAEIFKKRCEEARAPFKLVVREGKDHGWKEMGDDMKVFADWFDEHLCALKSKE